MRAFISVELPENVRREILKIQNQLPLFVGKLTEPENLHLTLKFLGEIDEDKVEEVRKRLRKVKLKKFEAEISEIGVFTPSFIKIIWVSFTGCDDLQKEVDNALEGLFPSEKRFMGHVTIARVKKCDKRKFMNELGRVKVNNINFDVDKFYLKESRLHEKGPEYKVVEEYGLN